MPFIEGGGPVTSSIEDHQISLMKDGPRTIPYSAGICFEAYKILFKIVEEMKEARFKERFQMILAVTWALILKSQATIQNQKTLESQGQDSIHLDDINVI